MKKLITFLAFSAVAATAGAQFYQQCPKLTAPGLAPAAQFGRSVALSSDATTAIVGVWGGVNGAVGCAVIYNRTGSAWSQGPTLIGAGATGGANQGHSVAISSDGNTVVIGGSSDNSDVGAAWVFTRTGGTWTQQGDKLVGTGATGSAHEGYSVAISGDGNTIMLGGPDDNADAGAAWIFERSGSTWSQQGAKIVGSGAAFSTVYQGFSVALSGDGTTAILGGWGDDANKGAVWMFKRSPGTTLWGQQGPKLTNGVSLGDYDALGTSVALSADGNTAIAGAAEDGGSGYESYTGAAYIFTRSSPAGVWTMQGPKLVGSYPIAYPQQGGSVSLSADGNTAAIGGGTSTFTAGAGDVGVGAVWVFTRDSGSVWNQPYPKYVGADNAGNSQQGASVAMSGDGNTFITGGYGDDSDAGAVWIFSQTIPTNFTSYVSSVAVSASATVYPNPATDQLTIDFKNAVNGPTTVTITDQLGRMISTRGVDGQASSYTEDVAGLVPGVYILTAGSPAAGEQKFIFVKK